MENQTDATLQDFLCGAEAPLHIIQQSIEVLSGKWTLLVLWHLWSGTRRFSELHAAVPRVSKHMLTTTLRDLERARLVERTVFPEVPPRVTYALTNEGRSLQPVFAAIVAWAQKPRPAR